MAGNRPLAQNIQVSASLFAVAPKRLKIGLKLTQIRE
jgi:hypothetical protein